MRMRVWESVLALVAAGSMGLGSMAFAAANSSLPQPVTLSAGWQLQDAAKVTEAGDAIASSKF